MSEAGGENLAQRAGTVVGVLAALLVLRRLRKRRKEKKLLKAQAKARARAKTREIERRIRERKEREKGARKAARKEKSKKGKKDRSVAEQLIRFAILAAGKKFISQQIEMAGKELGSSRLGKKVVEASGTG
ncbi:MAG: hypothetical protein PHP28_07375 [Actinomycetota bacterium]|nr:hypothetical protein [Actinomycetota bacterium]MDD5667786.1 hypothetical protein [Actinomycetota bacterium]